MASTASSYNPSRDDFAAMLDESFAGGNLQESSVIKGTVVAIEKDMAVIDVGLKTEGRVALREFNGPGREAGHPPSFRSFGIVPARLWRLPQAVSGLRRSGNRSARNPTAGMCRMIPKSGLRFSDKIMRKQIGV